MENLHQFFEKYIQISKRYLFTKTLSRIKWVSQCETTEKEMRNALKNGKRKTIDDKGPTKSKS